MHYISLGHFCSVAMELEKMGLRAKSFPFDWLISDAEGVFLAIEDGFKDFLEYDYMAQSRSCRKYYLNEKYKVKFFHDFDEYTSLEKQLPLVREKYNRRIERFYKTISEPTLFIRYISDVDKVDGASKELLWLEKNYERILKLLKGFNAENDLLFIANHGVESEIIKIYHVEKDEGDSVAREPFSKNVELKDLFTHAEVEGKQKNIDRYLHKERSKNKLTRKIGNKIRKIKNKLLLKEYVHDKQY